MLKLTATVTSVLVSLGPAESYPPPPLDDRAEPGKKGGRGGSELPRPCRSGRVDYKG